MGNIIDIPELKFVKSTLSNLNSDKDREFCTKLINYIDSSSSTNDDEFFYDMMIAIRFIDEPGVIAYTKEDKRIYLSAPGRIGDKLLPWDFTYDHECLHQLWESFGVAEKIKKKGIKYDHELFNIASDVVINDYLRDIRGNKLHTEPSYKKIKLLRHEKNIIFDKIKRVCADSSSDAKDVAVSSTRLL